jgi:hypothetical protein
MAKRSFYRDDISFLNMPEDEEEHSESEHEKEPDMPNFLNIEFNFEPPPPPPIQEQVIDASHQAAMNAANAALQSKFAATPNTALALLNRKQGKKPQLPIPVVLPQTNQPTPQFNFNLDDEGMATIYSQILSTLEQLPTPPGISLNQIQSPQLSETQLNQLAQQIYSDSEVARPKTPKRTSSQRRAQNRSQENSILLPPTQMEPNSIIAYSSDLVTLGVIDGETDKRIRNNAASARFRAKKKIREQALEAIAKDSVLKLEELERQMHELSLERNHLHNLVHQTFGAVPPRPPSQGLPPVGPTPSSEPFRASLTGLGVEVDENTASEPEGKTKKSRGRKPNAMLDDGEMSIALTSTTDAHGRKVYAPAVVPVKKK